MTFTATVTASAPGSGTPTGTVTFMDGAAAIGTGTLNASGVATYTTTASPLSVGSGQSITAVYGGDGDFTTSTSTALSQTVNQDSSATSVVSSANPSVYGQPVTFTATVTASAPGSGTPTGTVQFLIGGSDFGGPVTLVDGSATSAATSSLSVAGNTIKASYSGDTNFKTSSGTLTQTVNQDSTTTSIGSSANPSVYGQSVTFTATVAATAPGSGIPTGTVTFTDGTTTLGTVTLSGGTASYSTAKLATASHSITATYNGSGSFVTSSGSLSQTVNQDATTSSVASSLNPSTYGQAVTFTATVSASSPGSGTPTGTVTFYFGTTSIGTGTLSGGKATLKTSTLPAGSDSITVAYGGDTNFLISTSAALTQTVNPDGTTTKLTSSANPSVYGQAVTFTATVKRELAGERDADRDGHVLRRLSVAGQRDAECQRRGDLHDNCLPVKRGQRSIDHGGLRRRRQFHDQHLDGPVADGQPGQLDDDRRFLDESIGVRPAGDLHGDRNCERSPAAERRPGRSRSMTARRRWERARSAAAPPASRRRRRFRSVAIQSRLPTAVTPTSRRAAVRSPRRSTRIARPRRSVRRRTPRSTASR